MTDARGFWTVALSFFLIMSFMTVPTPLYGLYEQKNGFGSFTVTLIFAAYGVGVLVGLLLGGHVSDHLGRRRVLVTAAGLEVVGAMGFAMFAGTGALVALRFVTGLGVGVLSPAATAYLVEAHARWRPAASPVFGHLTANVANLGGLAMGPIIAGLLSQLPRPISAPYAVYVLVVAAVMASLTQIPETVPSETRARPWTYRPQRVAVADDTRGAFVGAAVAAFAGFAVLGFITSLTGKFLSQVVGVTSRIEIGGVATFVLLGAVLSQVVFAHTGRRRQLFVGSGLVVGGMSVLVFSAMVRSLQAYALGGFLATGGVGLVFAAAVATVSAVTAENQRGVTLAALFTAAYVGITVPVVAIGALLLVFDLVPVLVGFAAVVALSVPAGIALLERQSE